MGMQVQTSSYKVSPGGAKEGIGNIENIVGNTVTIYCNRW